MKWQPSFDPQEEQQLKTGYISDNTAFMRWSTELEKKQNVTDDAFMERNKLQIMALDKFPALAFYEDPRMLRLRKRKMLNVTLAKNAGLMETCEDTVLSSIDDVQTSRGWKGNYSKALITQRHELREEKTDMQKKVGFWNRFMGGQNKGEEQQQQGGMQQ